MPTRRTRHCWWRSPVYSVTLVVDPSERRTAPAIGRRSMNLNDKTRATLGTVSTATLTTQLLKRGYRNTFMQGVRPLLPPPRSGTAASTAGNMVGVAVTIRYIPAREDLATMESLGSQEHPQRKAIETIPAG